ncbi:MAG TPA: tetratricopeptide repeat protein [Thermoanaerobaculia bacterium]
MLTLKNLRLLFGGREGRKPSDAGRLDAFLADPALVRSLREEEQHRKRLPLILLSLVLGLLLGAGGVLLALHPWRPAATVSRTGVTFAEEMARTLASQGQAYIRAKEIDKALSHSRLATELAPNLVDAWDALARSLFYAGQTAEGEEAARRCLRINPAYSRGYHILGDFSFYTGDWKQAEAYWKKAPDARRGLARLLLLENRFEEATPLVRRLVRETPDEPYARIMREALQLGRLTPDLRRKLAPDFVASRNPETAQGWRLFYARRYEEAAATFSRAVSRDPRDGSAIIGHGWSLLKTGAPREAQSAFEQALATWPTSYSALNGLAWSRKAQGQEEGALTIWHEVVEELPRTDQVEIPDCLKGLGMVYYERGDYVRANHYLARSLLINPSDKETATLLQSTLAKLAPS